MHILNNRNTAYCGALTGSCDVFVNIEQAKPLFGTNGVCFDCMYAIVGSDKVTSVYRDVDELVCFEYRNSLMNHIRCVQTACHQLGVTVEQARVHDLSKWSLDEYPHYARYYYQGKNNKPEYFKAVLHHFNQNPHHWQHWIFPNRIQAEGTDYIGGVVPMPEKYALEMVADWMGAGMSYNESGDMSKWLSKGIPTITLHKDTADYVTDVLVKLGYGDILEGISFNVPS